MGETVGSGTGSEHEEEEDEEEEEEEKQESWESEASNRSAASDDEEENSLASCSQDRKRRITVSEDEDEHTLSWIRNALDTINAVDSRMISRSAWITHPSPKSCLPDLEKVRNAAMLLVNNTDAAISLVKSQQSLLDRKALEGKLHALQQELAQSVEQSQAEHRKQAALLQQSKAAQLKQNTLFQKEKESLTCSHKLEREALIDQYSHEQRDLKRQLEEERDKSICCVCHDKPRDTIILPCLHFQYCFSCLLRHRDANSNTCPTCRGPIQGLSMSSYLATQ